MLFASRNNYNSKIILGEEYDCVTAPLLLRQVKDLNVQIPDNVKNIVVDSVNNSSEDDKNKNNEKLQDIIYNIKTNPKENKHDEIKASKNTSSSSSESLRKKSDGINYRKYSSVSDNWRGNSDIRMGYYNDYADPNLIYNGYTFNYYDIENAMYYN